MTKSSIIFVLLALLTSLPATADISRGEFVDQLDSANCNQVPPEIYIDAHSPVYDLASALSLAWISVTTLSDNYLNEHGLAENWQLSNIEIIHNSEHELKILIADYQDSLLVAFRHTDKQNDWLYQSNEQLDAINADFSLGEETHLVFSHVLDSEWKGLLESVQKRVSVDKPLLIFGHHLGGALAQLSATGFQAQGIHVNQVYLSAAPKVGSSEWAAKASQLLKDRVFRLSLEDDSIARLPLHNGIVTEFSQRYDTVPSFISNTFIGQPSQVPFQPIGQEVSIDNEASTVTWDEADSFKLEQQYWHDLANNLNDAQKESLNLIPQINNMMSLVTTSMDKHELRGNDGYLCNMISALENEF
jgi:Lipase (class 3)